MTGVGKKGRPVGGGGWVLAGGRDTLSLPGSSPNRLARRRIEFTAEDVRQEVGAPLACRPAVMGAMFRVAAAAGEIRPVGYRKARRPEAHGRILRTWVGTA